MATTTLPTLYKLDTQQRKRIWSISVTNNGNDKGMPEIHVRYGLENGAQVNKIFPIAAGKGGKTPLEQAISEAKSKFNEKINREGYVIVGSGSTGNDDDDNDVETDELMIPRPMLAKTFTFDTLTKKSGKIVFPAFVQPKLDGIRCFARISTGVLTSRQMKQFETLDHIAQEVSLLGKEFPELNKFWLDGEIYHHEIEFGVIQGICNSKTTSKSLADKMATALQLKYFIYDCYDHNNQKMPFVGRNNLLRTMFAKCPTKFKHLVLLETATLEDAEDITTKHTKYTEKGYEGIILRNSDGPYEINKRSQHLQKYKSFLDEEFPIIDFKAADNDYYEDASGKQFPVVTWICQTKDGGQFSCKMKATKQVQHQYLVNGPKYVGGLLTVMFQEYTPDGIPRFPVGKEIRDFTD